MVPCWVEVQNTVTPIKGVPFASVILPLTVACFCCLLGLPIRKIFALSLNITIIMSRVSRLFFQAQEDPFG